MRRARWLPLLALLPLVGTGCVTKAKYRAVRGDLANAEAQLTAERERSARETKTLENEIAYRDNELSRLDRALALEQEEVDALAREIDLMRSAIADRDRELAGLQDQITARDEELAAVLRRRAGLKASLEKMGEALADLTKRKLIAERRVAEYREMLARFQPLIDAGTLDVRIVDGRMVLTLPMDILFATGKTDLSADGKTALGQIAVVLRDMPERQFMVEGHTDDVPIHNARFASNWELAAGRAMVVVHTLRKAGMADVQLAAASLGEHHPRVPNRDEASRALNRRIEIVVVPDLTGLPGYDELEAIAGD